MSNLLLPQLYLPATDPELRGFSYRLDSIRNRLTGNFAEHQGLDLNIQVNFGEGDAGNICLNYEPEEDIDIYNLCISRVVPIDNRMSPEIAKSLLNNTYTGFDQLEDPDVSDEAMLAAILTAHGDTDNGDECDNDEDEYGPEGYIEHDKRLQIVRCRRAIFAQITYELKILDIDKEEVNTVTGFNGDKPVKDNKKEMFDLEQLVTKGERVIYTDLEEALLVFATPADLIICTLGLIRTGLLDKRTSAYPGSKECAQRPFGGRNP